jgi:hypothetical protein
MYGPILDQILSTLTKQDKVIEKDKIRQQQDETARRQLQDNNKNKEQDR